MTVRFRGEEGLSAKRTMRRVVSPAGASARSPVPAGAVRAHHHAHHECRRQTLRLPLGLPHLPVLLHAHPGHPVLKLLRSGE